MRSLWPGRRRPESVDDYLGVLVPLEQAHLHSHSARIGRCEFEEGPGNEDNDDDDDGDDGPPTAGTKARDSNEGTGMLEMLAAEYSIEGLRREVRKGGKGPWTEYERESFSLLARTRQRLGGRYTVADLSWSEIETHK